MQHAQDNCQSSPKSLCHCHWEPRLCMVCRCDSKDDLIKSPLLWQLQSHARIASPHLQIWHTCYMWHTDIQYMLHAGQVEVYSVCGSQEEQCDNALQKVCVIVIVMVTESPGFEWLCQRRVCIALQLAQQQMIYQLKTNRSPVAVPTAKPCKDGFASLANLICWRSRSLNNLKLTRRIGM